MHTVPGMVDEVEQRGWMKKLHAFRERLPPGPRKVAVTIIGGALLVLGVAMMVLPGPAFIVIPAGLALLSTEYRWAKRFWDFVRRILRRVTHRKRRAPDHRDRGMGELARRGFRVPS